MEIELKPCPICRGPATSGEVKAGEDGYCYIECKVCNRRDPHYDFDMFFGIHADDPTTAMDVWNTLPRPSPLSPETAERLRIYLKPGWSEARRYELLRTIARELGVEHE